MHVMTASRPIFVAGLLIGACGDGAGPAVDAGSGAPAWGDLETVLEHDMLRPAFNNARLVTRTPDGTVHAVIGTGGVPMYAWRSPGAAWRSKPLAGSLGPTVQPALAWSASTLYVAWVADGSVVLMRSAGGDAAWDPPVTIASTGQPERVSLHATAAAVVLAWTDRASGRVMFVPWTGGPPPAPAPLDDGQGTSEDVALFGDGDAVWATWDQRPASNMRTIRIARSRDGGLTFDPASMLAVTQAGRPMASGNDPAGCAAATAVWVGYQDFDETGANRVYLARSQDGGQTFSPRGSVGPGLFAHLACDAAGAVGVVWEHFEGSNPFDDTNKTIGVALSLDGGERFDAPHAMPGAAQARERVFPALSIADDVLDVMFVDKPSTSWLHTTATLVIDP